MRISPDPVEACEGELIQPINIRVDGGRMDTQGNAVANFGGEIDWDDGTTTGIFSGPLNQNLSHQYLIAKTYHPSATFAMQFAYTGNGSCGYRCRLQQSAIAIIYLKSSPQCGSGRFSATKESIAVRNQELRKLDTRQDAELQAAKEAIAAREQMLRKIDTARKSTPPSKK